jgi:hypothetical protein
MRVELPHCPDWIVGDMYQLFAGCWPCLADRACTAEGMNRTNSSVATNDDVQSRPRFGSTWSASPFGGFCQPCGALGRFRGPGGGSWCLFRGSAALVAFFWQVPRGLITNESVRDQILVRGNHTVSVMSADSRRVPADHKSSRISGSSGSYRPDGDA